MHIQSIYRIMCVLCTLTVICASPLSKPSAVLTPSALARGRNEKWTLHRNQKHREKRQLTSFLSNNDFLQALGQTFRETLDRIREVVSNGPAPDSPLVRMVNDFRTRIAPEILRTIYTNASQNVWDQIRNQARNTLNELLERK